MLKFRHLSLVLCLVIQTSSVVAEPIDALSLKDFITIATSKDSVFEQILIDRLVLKYQKDLELPPRDIVLAIQQEHQLNLSDSGSNLESNISLSKLFPKYGTLVSSTYSVEESRDSGQRRSDLDFSIAQPIARNAFGRATRLRERVIGIEIDVAKHQIVEAYEDYFALIISAYISWNESWERLEIGKSSFRENQKLLQDIMKREAKKVALPIDVNKVKLQVLAKEEALVELRENHAITTNIIMKSLRAKNNQTYRPVSPSKFDGTNISFENEFEIFKQNRRTFAILKLLEKKSDVQVLKDADDLLPSIQLTAGYRMEGEDYGLENSEDFLFTGVSISLPFTNQVEKAEHQISKINAKKRSVITVNTRHQLYTDAKNIHRQIVRESELLSIAKKKIKLAKLILSAETENYTFGKVTLNDYIDAVNTLDTNRFSAVSRQARLRRLFVEWLRLTDQLVKKSDIAQMKDS